MPGRLRAVELRTRSRDQRKEKDADRSKNRPVPTFYNPARYVGSQVLREFTSSRTHSH